MIKHVLLALAFLITSVFSNALAVDAAQVTGVYRSYSESEFEITVSLKPDGSARVSLENWIAGERRFSVEDVRNGTWKILDGKIELTYTDKDDSRVVDYLTFNPALSRKDMGEEGTSSGIETVEPFDNKSLVGKLRLWREAKNSLNAP